MSMLDRWPGLRVAAHRSPIVHASIAAGERDGASDAEILAMAATHLEALLYDTQRALCDAQMRLPPPPIVTADGAVYDYVGPCPACGRKGPRTP